jgi:hypothetical protein
MATQKYLVLKNIAHNSKKLHATIKLPEVALEELNKNIPSGTPKWEIERVLDSEHILSLVYRDETSSRPTPVVNNTYKDWFHGCLKHGLEVYHTGSCETTWIGIYDRTRNRILYNGEEYSSPSKFGKAHYKVDKPNRDTEREVPGWNECKYKNEQGQLRPIDELRPEALRPKSKKKSTAGQQTQQ